jgi:hypothetical protein
LLAHLFLNLHETDFIHGLLKTNDKRLSRFFNFIFHYIHVDNQNNSKLGDYLDHIYPIELEIKYTTDTARSASYLDLHIAIDGE